MNNNFTSAEKAFLLELKELTRRHRIAIVGCGCCGSPSLEEIEENDFSSDDGYGTNGISDIAWISKSCKYDWDRNKHTIV